MGHVDHDKTVLEARNNMAGFDRRRDLERWLQNYVHPELGVPDAYWCTCVKVEKRWKVEYGLLSGTEPRAWCWADPGAPEPPILDFRKPMSEPVKPRMRVPKPRHVDAFDRMRAAMEAEFLKPFVTSNTTTSESSLTIETLMESIRNLSPELRTRPRVRLPVWREFNPSFGPDDIADAPDIKTVWADPKWALLSQMDLREQVNRITGLDRFPLDDLPDPPKKPAPEPSKRNQ